MSLFLHAVINHLQVNRFYQLLNPLCDNIVGLILLFKDCSTSGAKMINKEQDYGSYEEK